MSNFLSLSDDDIELLNRQFGLKLNREEWNRKLTTTPTFASLVRSYFDWHVAELAALSAEDDRLPAGIDANDAPFPPTARGASEPEARLRAALFMLETIRPIPEDGEAREKRISLLTAPLHPGMVPDAAFVRRVLYLAGRWYHRPDQMDAEGARMLREYLLRFWPEYSGEPVTTKLIRLWRTSEYVIGTVTINSTLN